MMDRRRNGHSEQMIGNGATTAGQRIVPVATAGSSAPTPALQATYVIPDGSHDFDTPILMLLVLLCLGALALYVLFVVNGAIVAFHPYETKCTILTVSTDVQVAPDYSKISACKSYETEEDLIDIEVDSSDKSSYENSIGDKVSCRIGSDCETGILDWDDLYLLYGSFSFLIVVFCWCLIVWFDKKKHELPKIEQLLKFDASKQPISLSSLHGPQAQWKEVYSENNVTKGDRPDISKAQNCCCLLRWGAVLPLVVCSFLCVVATIFVAESGGYFVVLVLVIVSVVTMLAGLFVSLQMCDPKTLYPKVAHMQYIKSIDLHTRSVRINSGKNQVAVILIPKYDGKGKIIKDENERLKRYQLGQMSKITDMVSQRFECKWEEIREPGSGSGVSEYRWDFQIVRKQQDKIVSGENIALEKLSFKNEHHGGKRKVQKEMGRRKANGISNAINAKLYS